MWQPRLRTVLTLGITATPCGHHWVLEEREEAAQGFF